MVLSYASIIISLHFQLCPSVTLRRTTSHPTDWNLHLLRPSLYPLLPPHPNTHKKTTFTPRVWAPLIIRRKHRPFFSFCLVTSLQYHTHFSPLTSHLVSHYKQALCQCGYYRLVSSARLPQAPWVFSFTQLGAEAAGEEEASPILCPRTAANAAYFLFSSVRTVYMQTPEGKKKRSPCQSVDFAHGDRRKLRQLPAPLLTPGLGVPAAEHDVPSGLCCLCQSHNSSNVHAVLNLVGLISDDDTLVWRPTSWRAGGRTATTLADD